MCSVTARVLFSYFFFNDTATTEIYTLSLHDALPFSKQIRGLDESPVILVQTGLFSRYVVTAPSDADETSLAYFAMTPVV